MELFVTILSYAAVALLFISLSVSLSMSRKNGRPISLTSILLKPFSGHSDPPTAPNTKPDHSS